MIKWNDPPPPPYAPMKDHMAWDMRERRRESIIFTGVAIFLFTAFIIKGWF